MVSEVWRGGEEEISQEKHMQEVRCTLCDMCRAGCHARILMSMISRVKAPARCSIDCS